MAHLNVYPKLNEHNLWVVANYRWFYTFCCSYIFIFWEFIYLFISNIHIALFTVAEWMDCFKLIGLLSSIKSNTKWSFYNNGTLKNECVVCFQWSKNKLIANHLFWSIQSTSFNVLLNSFFHFFIEFNRITVEMCESLIFHLYEVIYNSATFRIFCA